MKRVWPVRKARARFGELLNAAATDGPQIISRRGVETAVLVPLEEWQRLTRAAKPTLKELLLAPGARTENLAPRRGRIRRRPIPEFDD